MKEKETNGEGIDKIYLVDGKWGAVIYCREGETPDSFEARCLRFKNICDRLNASNATSHATHNVNACEQLSFEGDRACPKCHKLMKLIPAGVSHKTGKHYKAFWICNNCKYTEWKQ